MSDRDSSQRKHKSHRKEKKGKKETKEKRKQRERVKGSRRKERRNRKDKRTKRSRSDDSEYELAKRIRKEIASKSYEPLFTFMERDRISVVALNPVDIPPKAPVPNRRRRVAGPISDQEYTRQKNTFKMVYDPQSGRTRCINGTGEIVERIVSREEHKRLNYIATHHPFHPL